MTEQVLEEKQKVVLCTVYGLFTGWMLTMPLVFLITVPWPGIDDVKMATDWDKSDYVHFSGCF